jgi:hypothetical protein
VKTKAISGMQIILNQKSLKTDFFKILTSNLPYFLKQKKRSNSFKNCSALLFKKPFKNLTV